MGLFDEIRCEWPLPDGFDASGIWFQTKSFPSPCLQRYTITSEGRLIDPAGNDLEPDGYISFYAPESRQKHSVTEGSAWRDYRAHFKDGQLENISRVSDDDTDRRYYGLASFRWFDAPSFIFDETD
jgi:hypothetical protein